ncbi:MAG TPA: class I SAM-dependent methyltransferase [Solirubrobacteraceae bacterium]|nr:class I SAM-dependent methyltransferase [Solirubrobacteraceae bacterium]
MNHTHTIDPVAELKDAHRALWASGDYPAIAAHIAVGPPAAAVAAAGVTAGDRVLDVATGSGNAALVAAGARAHVTGLDLVPELLDIARSRAAGLGLDVAFVTGDAEALPFDDASFDRVMSVFGIQFAPRHQVTADELVRVCAPGGAIALVNWTPGGLIGRLLKIVGRHLPPPPAFASPPPLWGDEDHVRALFAGHDVDLGFERATNPFRSPSVDAFTTLFEERYGPMIKARERLQAAGTWDECRAELRELYESSNVATDGTFEGPSEYVVITISPRG